jgi:hypothetical protein
MENRLPPHGHRLSSWSIIGIAVSVLLAIGGLAITAVMTLLYVDLSSQLANFG